MSVWKTISKYLSAALSISLVAGSIFAHPGHGGQTADGWSALHYLTSLQHLAPIVVVSVAVIVMAARAHRSKRRSV